MVKFCLLLFVVINSSCSTLFRRTPATSSTSSLKPRQFIITVHGITSNAQAWGHFAPLTEKYLTLVNPDKETIVSHFVYPTGRSEKRSTIDFANYLNQHIESLFKDRPLEPNDRISLVGHSQGGIVSYIWFFTHVLNSQLEQKFIKQVDTIITLGTPFWGSKLASIVTDKNNIDIVPLINLLYEHPVTRRELKDLSFGSDAIHSFRKLAIKMDNSPQIAEKIKSLPIRLVNIMGVLPKDKTDVFADKNENKVSQFARKMIAYVYKFFQPKPGGPNRSESDIAVIVPSSRWNFIYAQTQYISPGKNKIAASEFTHFKNFVDRSKFLFTESVHLPFDHDNTFSMAYINKSCEIVENCDHPTYRYILEQLANCKNASCDLNQYAKIIQKMKEITRGDFDEKNQPIYEHNVFKNISKSLETFSLQMDLKLKPGAISKFPVRHFIKNRTTEGENDTWELFDRKLIGKIIDLNHDENDLSIASDDKVQIYIGSRTERNSLDIVSREATTTNEHDIIRLNVSGFVKKENQKNGQFSIPISVNLPGLPAVDIDAVIQPGFSTYIPLDYTQLK